MVDLLVAGVLALAAAVGWRRGTVPMALSIGSLVAGYLAAWLLIRPAGTLLARAASLPPLLAQPLAAILVMAVVSLAFKFAAGAVERSRRSRRAEGGGGGRESTPANRVGGALLAAVWAFGIVLVLVWGLASVHSLTGAGPGVAGSLTGRLAMRAAEAATALVARRALGDPLLSAVAAHLVSDPNRSARATGTVMGDPRVHALWTNAALREALLRGDAGALAASADGRALAADPEFRAAAVQIGLLTPDAGADQVAAQLTARLTPLAQAVNRLHNDPDVRRMLDDPALRARLEQGDVTGLLADPAFNALAGRVLATLRAPR